MTISRGLIIADPWIGYILDGSKTWEMRSTPTAHRGWFGLIRKGTGEVYGIARLIGCGATQSREEMLASIEQHRIPERMISSGGVAKWVVPWQLADAFALPKPIPYTHRSGAVTWVSFEPDLVEALSQYVTNVSREIVQSSPAREIKFQTSQNEVKVVASISDEKTALAPKVKAPTIQFSPDRLLARCLLTAGNIRNNHFYLTGFLDQFPSDTIGGSNKSAAAAKTITIDWGGASPVWSDIDETKRFFRSRGWVACFFAANNAVEGDTVIVNYVAPYAVRVSLQKNGSL